VKPIRNLSTAIFAPKPLKNGQSWGVSLESIRRSDLGRDLVDKGLQYGRCISRHFDCQDEVRRVHRKGEAEEGATARFTLRQAGECTQIVDICAKDEFCSRRRDAHAALDDVCHEFTPLTQLCACTGRVERARDWNAHERDFIGAMRLVALAIAKGHANTRS
jgi:hypothetical protein